MARTPDTRLGAFVRDASSDKGECNGVYALQLPHEAFAARVLLARAAERTLDVQYYIWHGDTTGVLMFEELWNAAERGVRVRLLLDDNGIAGLDPTIAALNSHANIDVRLFNPFAHRRFKALDYLTDFRRLNRRMHNKSFTADAEVTIVGGRNVGDEYFGAGEKVVFADLDALAAGPVAREVVEAFDLFWECDVARRAELVVEAPTPDAVPALRARFAKVRASSEAVAYIDAVQRTPLVEAMLAHELALDWARVRLLCDPPSKVQDQAPNDDLLFAMLQMAMGQPEHTVDVVSPYFVPGKKGTAAFGRFIDRGVAVRIVTNSLAATDVSAVHAGYAKYRKPLLRRGARIFELKRDAAEAAGGGSGIRLHWIPGSSSASLHAKTFLADRSRVFIGSFNLDPRSIRLNTEMGLLIESQALAETIASRVDQAADHSTYDVRLAPPHGSRLEWVDHSAEGDVRHTAEPDTSVVKRLGVRLLEKLPIEWLL